MPNELDELMNLDPMELTRDSTALEALVQLYRKQRAEGKKPEKERGPVKPLSGVLDRLVKPKAAEPVAKTGLRRL